MDRRGFLERAGILAAGGVAAVKTPRAASAQSRARRPQRVAVVGVGHYHAFSPPNYLRILQTQKVDIVGVHDPDASIASKYATQVASTPFTDYRSMIENTKPDFVV